MIAQDDETTTLESPQQLAGKRLARARACAGEVGEAQVGYTAVQKNTLTLP